jgi:hypothetical protein
LEDVAREIEAVAHKEPKRLDTENLRRQFSILEYCLQRRLIMQAVTLAREWLVSRILLQYGQVDWLSEEQRERAEAVVGDAYRKWCRKEDVAVPYWFQQWPLSKEAARTWGWLSQLRNDVAHCGMNFEPKPADRVLGQAQEIPGPLRVMLEDAPIHALYGGRIVLDLSRIYQDTAKLEDLPDYVEKAQSLVGEGNEVVLTGQAPIWLYLKLAHALHGRVRRLLYSSPVTGEVLVFDHSAS